MIALGAIAVVYVAVILWMIIEGGKWYAKAAIICLLPPLVLIAWFSVNSYKGWPVPVTHIPAQAVFVSGVIDEPDPAAHDKGFIDLWMVPISKNTFLGHRTVPNEPRAFHLAYTRQLHKAVLKAQKIQQSGGQPILAETKTAKRQGQGGHISSAGAKYRVYQHPPSALPEKKR